MPLVRITHAAGKPATYRHALADGVHAALVETLNVPADDRFQIVTEQTVDGLIYDNQYLGIRRSDDLVFIQVFLRRGRSTAMKQDFYRRIADNLARNPGLAANDVFITLSENGLDDWSFGQGRAQYVENPPRPLTATPLDPASQRNDAPPAAAITPATTVAASAGLVLAGGLVMLALVALLHMLMPVRLEAALGQAMPAEDPIILAGFTA